MEGAIPVPPEHLHSASSQVDPRQVNGNRSDQWSAQPGQSYDHRRHDSVTGWSNAGSFNRVQTTYESYILKKAAPEKKSDVPTWKAAYWDEQPVDPAALSDRVVRSNIDVLKEHSRLADSQRNVIRDLILWRRRNELNPNAKWVLVYIKPDLVKDFFGHTKETRSINIILERQDIRNERFESAERRKSRQQENIIGLSDSKRSQREGSAWRDNAFRDVSYGDNQRSERPSLRDGRAYSQQSTSGPRMSAYERGSFPESGWQRSHSGGVFQDYQEEREPEMVQFVEEGQQPTRKKSKKKNKTKNVAGQSNMEENFAGLNIHGQNAEQQGYPDPNDPLATVTYDYVPSMQQQQTSNEYQASNAYQQRQLPALKIPVHQYHQQQQAQQRPAAPDAPQWDPNVGGFRIPAWQNGQADNSQRRTQQGVMDQYLNGQNDPFAATSALPQHHESARRSNANHPFAPLPGVGYPSHYDHDVLLDELTLHDVNQGATDFDGRPRSRSDGKRRSSFERKHLKRIEGKLDELHERLDQTNYATAGSSEGTQDGASMFSDPVFPQPFTPATTPPRSPHLNRGSLHGWGRKGSISSRDGRYTSGYRGRYSDEAVEIEPGQSSYRGRPRMAQRYATQDDYPRSAGGDGRMVAHPQLQRRATISAADMDRAELDEIRRQRDATSYMRDKRRARDVETVYEDYGNGRRHERNDSYGRNQYHR